MSTQYYNEYIQVPEYSKLPVQAPDEPFIIRKFVVDLWKIEHFRESLDIVPCMNEYVEINEALDRIDHYRQGTWTREDTKVDDEGHYMPNEVIPYITGWEYAAGDLGERLRRQVPEELCEFEDRNNILKDHEIAEVMKWVFIGPASSGSGMHVDPIAADAWMIVTQGNKKWRIDVETEFGLKRYKVQQGVGDLIFIPNGARHSVVNEDFSVAVTHNFVRNKSRLNSLIQEGLEYPDICDALLERLLLERAHLGFYFPS